MAATVVPMATRKRKRVVLREEDREKEEEKNLIKELTAILKKSRDQRTDVERELLRKHPEHVIHIQKRLEKYRSRKARQEEYEEPESVIADKSATLAEAIRTARHLVVYTGAGVSTSASIPDYRGPDGIWTRLSQGRGIGQHDLTAADPTVTHMSLYGLWQRGLVRHVVSQNCDGLHLRSGLPKRHMSELHGNMYLEVCASCPRQYVRSFDVTPKTSRQNHKTGRRCYECATPLIDTVVHFGERGSLRWPLNWRGACRQARRSDVILCLGSSLKVLRKYSGLWCMHRPPHKRPRLFIVNLQWTPKDDCAALKINGRCDDVMLRVMEHLGVPVPHYSRAADPLFRLATPLHRSEPAPRCKLTRPDTPPGAEGEEETAESGPGRPEGTLTRQARLEVSPSPLERAIGHPADRLADGLAADAARSPAQSAHRPGAQPVERRAAAPGRPTESAVSPQSPPLRLPEGGSLLLHTLLAGRPAAAAAGTPPESAAQRRWPADAVTCDVTELAGGVTAVTGGFTTVTASGGVTCAVTELRDVLVQTDPIDWREEEFTVVESLEETTCSSGDSCSEPGHSPDGRCSDLSHIRLMDGDRSPFCLSDDCLDRLSTSDVIFIDVPAAPPSLVDHDYSRIVGGADGGGPTENGLGGGGGGWEGQEAEHCESADGGVRVASHPSHSRSQSQSPLQYADAASQMETLESDSQADDSSQLESLAGDGGSRGDSQVDDSSQLESPAGDGGSRGDSQVDDSSQLESPAGDGGSRGDSQVDDSSQLESPAGDGGSRGDWSQLESLAGDGGSRGDSQVDDSSQLESLAGDGGSRGNSQVDDSSQLESPAGDGGSRGDSQADDSSQLESPAGDGGSRGDSSQLESLAGDGGSRGNSQVDDSSQLESPAGDGGSRGDSSQLESLAGDGGSRGNSQVDDSSQLESPAGDGGSRGDSQVGDASQLESSGWSRGDSQETGDGLSPMESQGEHSQPSQVDSCGENDSNRVNESRNQTSDAHPEPREEERASQTEFGDFDSLHEAASHVDSIGSDAVTHIDSADEDDGMDHEEGEEGWQESRDGFAPSQAESEDGNSASQTESRVMHDVWMDGGDSSQDSQLRVAAGKLAESRERWLDGVDSRRDGAESSQDGVDLRKEAYTPVQDTLDFIPDNADSIQDNDLNRGDLSVNGIDSNQDSAGLNQGNVDLSQGNADLDQDDVSSIQDVAISTRESADSSQEAEPAGADSGGDCSSPPAAGRRPGRACSRRAVSYRDPSTSSDSDSNDSDIDSGPPPELAASSESSSDSSSESDGGDYVRFQAVFRVSRRMLKPVLSQEAATDPGTGAGWYGRGCKARRKQRRLR